MRSTLTAALITPGAAVLLACAGGELRLAGRGGSPHATYSAALEHAGLETTALGRDWLRAADSALRGPTDVDLPHREVRYLDPNAAQAVALRLPLESGQRLAADIEVSGANPTGILVFLDLFFMGAGGGTPKHVASADSAAWTLDYVAAERGTYVLRVQPELLRGGRLTVTLQAGASLAFPVDGGDLAQMLSGFGASRDGGRREHDGIDLLAPRGTPVLAAADGRVTRAGAERLGGNVVWLRDATHRRRLYYAHLERHVVREDTVVRVGDTLGFVGTSGNADGEPPHLHLAVYVDRVGAVDPYHALFEPGERPTPFTADRRRVGAVARTGAQGATLHARPGRDAETVARLAQHVPIDILGGSGAWYFVRLPDGRQGYLRPREIGSLEPLSRAVVAARSPLRHGPHASAVQIGALEAGRSVAVLGRFDGFVLVRQTTGMQGWVEAAAVTRE